MNILILINKLGGGIWKALSHLVSKIVYCDLYI